ncbi:hypothetical protein BGX34_009456 [Mortierella sp. NVP85]|nr:hypothetical protein BGX34_009456 [Mortierella sp. NVP85]
MASAPQPQARTSLSVLSRPHPLRDRRRGRNRSLAQDPSSDSSEAPAPEYSLLPPTPAATLPTSSSIKGRLPAIPHDNPPPYSPPTTRPRNPLFIPELLARIGHFIPLWRYPCPDLKPVFEPKHLTRCTRVCRTWYNVLKPLVWEYYDDITMSRIPRPVVHRNAPLIRILNGRHVHHGVDFQCKNLLQLWVSPWISEVGQLIRENKKLEMLKWYSPPFNPKVPDSVFEAMRAGMNKLSVLEFTGCDLNPQQLFPLLENHLPKLRVLILHQVKILSSRVKEIDYEMGRARRPCFRQIREIRMGKGILQAGNGLLDLVRYCPNMERFVMEDMDQPWTMSITHGTTESNTTLDSLITNLSTFCPKLKSIVYRPNTVLQRGPALLQDAHYTRLVDCINTQPSVTRGEETTTTSQSPRGRIDSTTTNHEGGSGNEDDQPPIVHSFTADMLALETQTTLALCNMTHTLHSVSLRLHESKDENMTRANLLNAHQILTSCRVLKEFTLEYHNVHNFDIIASATTANALFDNPWICSGLEHFSINGIKRLVENLHGPQRPSSRTWPPVLVRLHELMTLAGLAKAPYIINALQGGQRRTRLRDLDELQMRMFGQLAQLKNMQLLTFNGETFREFSKLSSQ